MDRYRSYAPPDDLPLTEGDDGFRGVDSYNSPENIQPGMVQAAVNMDFTTQDAVTRGGFVCLPSVARTPLGITWTSRASAADQAWEGIAYGNGRFVAVSGDGGGNHVMTSPDGITWTLRASAADKYWDAVAFGNNVFVAVAVTGVNRVMTSPDGVTWTTRTPSSDNDWKAIAYGNGVFVAVGNNPGTDVMTSPDGITWTARTGAANNGWHSVAYGNGTFVAVAISGTGNRAMTSPDGITWTIRSTPADNDWGGLAFGNGLFVAVSTTGTGNRVMTSPDGITWTLRDSAADNGWNEVAFGNGLFVAVADTGVDNRVMDSPDGITWTARASAANNQWQSVAYGGGIFAAVSITGSGNRVMTARNVIYASGLYSDPGDPGSQWIMIVGSNTVGFYAFGKTPRFVAIDSAQSVSEMSTVVQCNNLVYIFRGSGETPLYWTGDWGTEFELAPTPTPSAGFEIIPNSNQATFAQDRLWVINGKDAVAASDILDFTTFDQLANEFKINAGSSDYLVATYPFGTASLIVFKNKSIFALTGIDGDLEDVVSTEITRQVGAIGINSVVSVGPDLVYMSDRNINLLTLTSTNNALQHKTLPLSTAIQSIIRRVNWQAASKVSMGYTDNKLYVALPLDNSTVCNAVVVYNFVTETWFGEWTFAPALGIAIQGWVVANYLGVQRMHCVAEDGRIFVTGEGQNDISGATVCEISTSLTTRAYKMDNNNRVNRRMWMDLGTNRPDFSVVSYVDGASESSAILTNQTYLRSQSWIFSDAPYDLTNANDDYNRPGRKDYASGPDSVECGSGFLPEMLQEFRLPIITRGKGRLTWFKITNEQGFISINGVGAEARAGDRSNLVQVL